MTDIRQNITVKDDFTRPAYPVDPIDGNWANVDLSRFAPMSIISPGVATHFPGQTEAASYWTGDAALDGDDQECWAFGIGGAASGIAFRLWLVKDVGTTSPDGYRASTVESSGTTSWSIVRYDNGTPTTLASGTPGPTGNPGYLLLRRNGGDIEWWHDTAGDGSNFVLLGSFTDSTYTTGLYPAIAIADLSSSQILGWTEFGGGPAQPFMPQIYRILRGFDA